MQYSVADAKNKLPELIKAVEDGYSVTICRRGVPVVDIVRTKRPTRKKRSLGTLKGKIEIIDPAGSSLDSFEVSIPSAGGMQINDLFHGRSLPENTSSVLIRVTTIEGMIGAIGDQANIERGVVRGDRRLWPPT